MPYLKSPRPTEKTAVSIHYCSTGAEKKRPILFSHGFAGAAALWEAQHQVISDHYHTLSWDMRGHGKSDSPDNPALYSEAHTCSDIEAILDAESVDEVVLAGHSMGGYMSLAYQLFQPERVKALILIDTGPGFKKDAPRLEWNNRAGRFAANYEKNGLAALPEKDPARHWHSSAQGLAHAARGMLAQNNSNVIHALPDIKIPVLVIVGEADKPFRRSADYLAAKIPKARLEVIANAGHTPNLEASTRFNQLVLEFLDKLN